jgi:hypothetical protein
MIIGAVVAFVGTVGAVALVRQRDYVVPGAPAPGTAGQPGQEEVAVPAAHG